MSDATSFVWVEVEGFRGFNRRQRINLDASAVIVVGPNGTGKTSFFDAVQWLLLGSLQRLEQWRVRKNAEHIVNRYRGSEPAVIEAELALNGSRVRLQRRGRYDEGLLEWHGDDGAAYGEEAELRLTQALTARSGQDLRRLLMSSALLQQDVVREVLEDKPAERYQHLAALLGLDDLSAFDREVRARAGRLAQVGTQARNELAAAQDRLETAAARVEALERDLRLTADVRKLRDEVLARLDAVKSTLRLASVPSTSADAALLQSLAQRAGEELASLAREGRQLAEARPADPPSEAALRSAEETAAAAKRAVATAQEALTAREQQLAGATARSSQLSALAVQALDLLGPECPVCGQAINEDHVRRHLQERIERREGSELNALVQAVEKSRSDVAAAKAEAERLDGELRPLLDARRASTEHQAAQRAWGERIGAYEAPEGSGIELIELDAIRRGDLDAVERALNALRGVWTAASDLTSVLRSDVGDKRLTDARAELRRARDALVPMQEAARLASEQEEQGKVVQRATTRAVTAVTDKRFKRLLPIVQDIYWRLDPHPSFTTFDFDLEIYRQRGIATPIVRDVAGDVEGDPLLVFSSSQANVAALSYFLALGWAAGSDALPFVLLDDPLQSMDDVNALGFADLCRHIRRQRQLVVSTHERRLGSLLKRKLAPRVSGDTTRVVEFKAWTRDGPVIDQEIVPAQHDEGAYRALVQTGSA